MTPTSSMTASPPAPASDPPVESDALLDWDDVRQRLDWTGILIGNGASIAFWDDFRYDSIFERAQLVSLTHSLSGDDKAIFDAFNSTNFEQALAALKTSRVVLAALGRDPTYLKERYDSIQAALFDAIHSVRVPWSTHARFLAKLQAIRDELVTYKWVYSLNYDLVLYWAIMSRNRGRGVADFFWQDDLSFNPGNVVPLDYAAEWTRVVWLHGGIHLRRHIDGTIYKERAAPETAGNLLTQFQTSYTGNTTPLLVSEGTAEDKYRAITRSSYLEFALRRLGLHDGGLIVFGSSLRSEDQHLVRAIKEQPVANLAFSMRPGGDPDAIRSRKAELRAQFPRANLYFFSAATHPLGADSLKVKRGLFGGVS
jgi:uncharacterized protein DUF4917